MGANRPQLRPDLSVRPLQGSAEGLVKVSYPGMAGAATFSSRQYQLLELLDGRRSLEDVVRAAKAQLRISVSATELENLVSTLRSLELLVHDGSVVVPLRPGGWARAVEAIDWFPEGVAPEDEVKTEVRAPVRAPERGDGGRGARRSSAGPDPGGTYDDLWRFAAPAADDVAPAQEPSEEIAGGRDARSMPRPPSAAPPPLPRDVDDAEDLEPGSGNGEEIEPRTTEEDAPDGSGEAQQAEEGEVGEPPEEEDEARVAAVVQKRRRRHVRLAMILAVPAGIVGVMAIIPFELWVNEHCALIPSQRMVVRSELDGLIRTVHVREGNWVKKGQLLVEMEDREIASAIEKLRAKIRRARAELARLEKGARREELAQARQVVATKATEVRFAELAEARNVRMASQNLVSKERLEAARRDLAVRRREYGEARAALSLLLAGNRKEIIEAKKAEIEQYSADLEFRSLQLSRARIHSPISGRIVTPRMEEMENIQVRVGHPLAEVVDTSVMHAEISVPERELDAVRRGLPVEVKVRSYPETSFWGKVVRIGQKVESGPVVNTMRVMSEIHNVDQRLKPDMTGNAKIYCGKRSVLNLVTRRLMRWVRVEFVL